MAYISSFTYCEDIQQEILNNNVVPKIINPLGVIQTLFIPTHFSFAISCVISGININTDKSLRIIFISPNEEIINDTQDIQLNIPPNNGDVLKFNLIMKNIVLKDEGVYRTEVYLNKNKLNEYKIEVKRS